jgi:hypothetical protein
VKWLWLRLLFICFWLPVVILSALVVIPAAMLLYVVALPAVVMFEVPVWLGFGNISLGRFGTLAFGSSGRQNAPARRALAELFDGVHWHWEAFRRPEQARQRVERESERLNAELQEMKQEAERLSAMHRENEP